jgi:hypothetical protein
MLLQIGQKRPDWRLKVPLLLAGSIYLLIAHIAGAEQRTITAIGHGTEICSAWTNSRRDGYSAGYSDWLLGYIVAANVWGPTAGRDLLRRRNATELIEWVDGYCREHPDEIIETVARKLVLALGRRAKEEGRAASIGSK